jgi:hypothetical protein
MFSPPPPPTRRTRLGLRCPCRSGLNAVPQHAAIGEPFNALNSADPCTRRVPPPNRPTVPQRHPVPGQVTLRRAGVRGAVSALSMIVVAGVTDRAEVIDVLAGFREQLYRCMTRRADALFELTDALLCIDGPVKTLVGLSLAPEHRRGHGAMYDALNAGRIDVESLRRQLAGCRCRGPRTAAWSSRWMSRRGCARTATAAAALVLPHLRLRQGRTPHDPGLALLDRRRPGDRPGLLDGAAGRRPAAADRGRHDDHLCADPADVMTVAGRWGVDPTTVAGSSSISKSVPGPKARYPRAGPRRACCSRRRTRTAGSGTG